MVLHYLLLIIIGFGGGVVISGGVFAFIAIIGIVPRLAQKTATQKYIWIYEDAIMFGGMFGTLVMIMDFELQLGNIGGIVYGFFSGIFVGCLAVSLAEVLDVIPILTRRFNIKVGMTYFIVTLAIGKLIGSLLYFIIPGFYKIK
ncbi:stage V sporulation protein AB [Vallitalea sp.]|jgi:stage V sporulation protein AB|uniref:stage V sporulation protein AB n=1 Tax=Vallitalea sp. TaxID=1882829 RepID=UPI0025E4B189|nr:stage V sporulation protein AB [Vallitalea sp.]MCT4686511.1 stage V sporulation protein AB [Vallitalea sp.]